VNATRRCGSNVPEQLATSGSFFMASGPKQRAQIIRNIAGRWAVLPRQTITNNICLSPSPQLLQHQWAKHGSCIAKTPEAYFGAARLLFHALEFPDMARLSREPERGTPLTAATIAERFAELNDGMPADSVTVKVSPKGWLQEIRICLDRTFKPRRCPSFSRAASRTAHVKIWRGR
jgi:ribonuclease T2